jgi:hypothetical protein
VLFLRLEGAVVAEWSGGGSQCWPADADALPELRLPVYDYGDVMSRRGFRAVSPGPGWGDGMGRLLRASARAGA